MLSLRNKFVAWSAVAALGAASLFAAPTSPAGYHGHRHGGMGAFLSSYLNLTPAQQAQRKSILQSARQSALVDPHSPGKWRVNGSVQNFDQFGKAFSCKKGAPMYPENSCRVW